MLELANKKVLRVSLGRRGRPACGLLRQHGTLVGVGGVPNVWLIAGGRGKGLDYHGVGPLLSQRVKGWFLIGEEVENLRPAWGLFTPCTPAGSLLEAVAEAARNAAKGDVVLLSPACSSFDQFRDYQHRWRRLSSGGENHIWWCLWGKPQDAWWSECMREN